MKEVFDYEILFIVISSRQEVGALKVSFSAL